MQSFSAGKTIPEKCRGRQNDASVAIQEGPQMNFCSVGRSEQIIIEKELFVVTRTSTITHNKT